jgi:hypothetical protein
MEKLFRNNHGLPVLVRQNSKKGKTKRKCLYCGKPLRVSGFKRKSLLCKSCNGIRLGHLKGKS